jgi:hypothetical protein
MKIKNLLGIKIKDLCLLDNTFKQVKRQSGKRYLQTHTFEKSSLAEYIFKIPVNQI